MTAWKTETYGEIILFMSLVALLEIKLIYQNQLYWDGQNVCPSFSVTSYGNTQTNFLANPMYL